MTPHQNSSNLAALDLGSNSFHMVIARQEGDGRVRFVDRVKEMVRLNAGLDQQGNLDQESMDRAIDCLQRFSQRLRGIPAEQIRAVGTNTFRAAHNSQQFIDQAEAALGQHISIISGHEEARLVYLGAAFSLEARGKQRLVVDIGGGSTELIVGKGHEAIVMNSLYMGCVSLSRRFFDDGVITAERLETAKTAAFQELEPIIVQYRGLGWEEVVGTSGTIRAVDDLSRALGLTRDWLTPESFELIDSWLVKCGHCDALNFISDRRKPVFPGGYAIISAIFDALKIERLDCASGALREGVLYDLNGRLQDHDSRDQGVQAMVSRFGLDTSQSERIHKTAAALLKQVAGEWNLQQVIDRKLLHWACQLHESGINIAFNQYHKHGAYIIENSDIDGFSRQQQRLLALLVRSHRQKFPADVFGDLPQTSRHKIKRLAILLRLSCVLNRSRSDQPVPQLQQATDENHLKVIFDRGWLAQHPLTKLDFAMEKNYLAQADFHLEICEQ